MHVRVCVSSCAGCGGEGACSSVLSQHRACMRACVGRMLQDGVRAAAGACAAAAARTARTARARILQACTRSRPCCEPASPASRSGERATSQARSTHHSPGTGTVLVGLRPMLAGWVGRRRTPEGTSLLASSLRGRSLAAILVACWDSNVANVRVCRKVRSPVTSLTYIYAVQLRLTAVNRGDPPPPFNPHICRHLPFFFPPPPLAPSSLTSSSPTRSHSLSTEESAFSSSRSSLPSSSAELGGGATSSE